MAGGLHRLLLGVVPQRADRIATAIANDQQLSERMFVVTPTAAAIATLAGDTP